MKTVLLTGGAGAVGSAVVPELLVDPDLRLILLLRPAPDRSVPDRVEDLKAFWTACGLGDSAWRRVEFLVGDVSLERVGLAPGPYAVLADRVTNIVHGAAQVKVNMTAEEARRSSVATTVHVLALAREARFLEKLEYLSTVGVAGTFQGAIEERRIREPRGFHNTYESSKAEAEDLVWEAMENGLPVTIHRPSMVVGDSRNGRTLHFQVFYHLAEFLSGRATAGWVPRLPSFRLDVVPNDYLARAIAASVRTPAWAGQVLHLAAGREGSWPLERYVESLPGWLTAAGLPTPRPHRLPWGLFRALVSPLAWVGPARRRKAFRHLPRFLSYLNEETYFDNRNARRLLEPVGIRLPDLSDYLPRIMAYYTAHRPVRGEK